MIHTVDQVIKYKFKQKKRSKLVLGYKDKMPQMLFRFTFIPRTQAGKSDLFLFLFLNLLLFSLCFFVLSVLSKDESHTTLPVTL